MRETRLQAAAAWAVILVSAVSCAVAGESLRIGARTQVTGSASPAWSVGAALDAFAGWGDLEFSSGTQASLFPYSIADQTVALSLTREWLSLAASYTFSVVPIGITSAGFVAHAAPPSCLIPLGALLFDLSVEGEARLKGSGFASTPLRAELWVEGHATVSRSLGCIDLVSLGAGLAGTLSSPGGTVWPTPSVAASVAFGRLRVASETEFALAGGIDVASEKLSLYLAWHDVGLATEVWCTFSGELRGPDAGLRVSYEFGSLPRRPFPGSTECAGGVCR